MGFVFPTKPVVEGAVEVLVPKLEAFTKAPSDYAPSKAPVFYNPLMEVNRDLAVLALRAFHESVGGGLGVVCEPLSGCGIRGIRLACEVDGVEKVIVNDINTQAYLLSKLNVEKNGLVKKVAVRNEDANFLLSHFGAPRKRFKYVDIDPFGSPMPYLDSALRALRSGGMIALTATDLAPLCGVHPNACIRKYGGKPLRTEYCQELAIRLLAGSLARTAAKYDIGVKILFYHSSNHYIRLYAKVSYGAKKANTSLGKMGYIQHCFACFHRKASSGMFNFKRKRCPECGKRMSVAGPLWVGKIAEENFVIQMEGEAKTRAFRQKRKIRKLLALIEKEAKAPITYYRIDKICDKLNLPMPPTRKLIEKLKEEGYKITLTHFKAQGIKTDAPAKAIKQVIKNLHEVDLFTPSFPKL